VTIPNGSLSISALPWAEVLVDRRPVGTTPLGNLSVPVGTHEIVWRHPQLGERTRTVTVPARTPVRVGVDFSR
jgi:serine/threonine-protein kinase